VVFHWYFGALARVLCRLNYLRLGPHLYDRVPSPMLLSLPFGVWLFAIDYHPKYFDIGVWSSSVYHVQITVSSVIYSFIRSFNVPLYYTTHYTGIGMKFAMYYLHLYPFTLLASFSVLRALISSTSIPPRTSSKSSISIIQHMHEENV